MSAPWSGRRLHFVGVGGAGMSGYARAAHALGAQISGSDRADSPYLERLRADGVLEASIGHDAANLPAGGDVEVVYSSAILPENPERAEARERGLRERPRAELLGELSALRRTIAVAGTHGKTTTASMLVHTLRAAGADPGWLVGAPVGGGLPNAHWGSGEWLVMEADESDRSMLSLAVEIAVLTNVELDHHASFASLKDLRSAFRAFLALARSAVVVWDRPELVELAGQGVSREGGGGLSGRSGEGVSVEGGMGVLEEGRQRKRGAQVLTYDVPTPTLTAGGSHFAWHEHEVRLTVPGAHNALNAAAALEAAYLAGADSERAIAGLAGFTGAARRFQRVGATAGGGVVYEDYAHHPTEVAATLRAARTLEPRRLVAVFQPHLYSRTALLAREFGEALALADVTVVLDVYPARERAEDFPGVSGLTIALATADAAGGRPVMWLPTFADALPVLRGLLVEDDLCLVMGAGDVDALGRRLAESVGDAEAPGREVGGTDDVEVPERGLAEGGARP
jgi:UDP-N-acetylmuramate--alanine ligase